MRLGTSEDSASPIVTVDGLAGSKKGLTRE
jgi:hypothetical protein